MKNIVVATDLSGRSRPAVRRAVNLATEVGAGLVVLHVVDNALPGNLSNQVQVGAETILSGQVAEDAGDRGLVFEVEVTVGDVVEEIDRVTQAAAADLLIVGLHRRRKFLDQIRETTMEHLVRSSPIPVLLVTGQADHAYTNVLCGIDLSDVCAAALHKIPLVAPQSELTLFHAHEISFGKEARRDYEIWKAIHPLPYELPDPIFVEARAGDALHDIMKDGTYDLLAIGGHTRASAGRYLLGGFTADLVRNPPCDLLIAK